MLKWIIDRAQERSTWAGIIAIATAAGVSLSPEAKDAIITLGLALAGAVLTLTKDKLPKE